MVGPHQQIIKVRHFASVGPLLWCSDCIHIPPLSSGEEWTVFQQETYLSNYPPSFHSIDFPFLTIQMTYTNTIHCILNTEDESSYYSVMVIRDCSRFVWVRTWLMHKPHTHKNTHTPTHPPTHTDTHTPCPHTQTHTHPAHTHTHTPTHTQTMVLISMNRCPLLLSFWVQSVQQFNCVIRA